MKALVLIKFSSSESRQAYHRISSLKSIADSSMLYGRYDAVFTLQAKDLEEIHDIILSDIQPVTGVIEILPCILVENGGPAVDMKIQPQQSSA